jgi:predicted ATPase
VVTGGPGAGKTAVLELVKRNFCKHVLVLPEAASVIFSGGFTRRSSDIGRKAAQRAIFHVQRELETIALEERSAGLVLCDRGTLDGLAYWPGKDSGFFGELGIRREGETRRYMAVIHLRTPTEKDGYNHENPMRIESPQEAHRLDEKIFRIWKHHPRRIVIESHTNFLDKANHAISFIREFVPRCCLGSAGKGSES